MARRTAVALAWLVVALVIALGAAGIVAALDHLPGGTGRPELTWSADRDVADDLDAASSELLALAGAVGVLGEHGRAALSALVGRDEDGLGAAIADGQAQLDAIDAATSGLRERLAAIPLDGPDRSMTYSPATLARYDALVAALPSVDPLRPSWERLAAGVAPAVELTRHLLAHDELAAAAVKLGGTGAYADAIAKIDEASAELDAAVEIRDRLAATVDVTTLDEWIARNAAYDDAVRDLWAALRRSGDRVTDEVRDAAERERTAKEALPPDARALVVILGDVARGGLNQAVIRVEEVRGDLLDAVARANAAPQLPSDEPAGAEDGSPSAQP